jgi:hypothetical protein
LPPSNERDMSSNAAAATSSVRETAIASKPLKTDSSRVAPKFDVRFEY